MRLKIEKLRSGEPVKKEPHSPKGEYGSQNNELRFFGLLVFDDPEEEFFDFRIQICKGKGRCLTLRCNTIIDVGFKIEEICRGEHRVGLIVS